MSNLNYLSILFYKELLFPVRQHYFSQPIENRAFSELDKLFGNIAVKNDLNAT